MTDPQYNSHQHPAVKLSIELIQRPSVTPDDAGCQIIIAQRLKALGFSIEQIDKGDVINLWARRGEQSPTIVLAGHTDVVPVGDESQWTYPPFSGMIANDHLHGRGSADMKSGLAALLVAAERFIALNPNHKGSIAVLITSDEEGPSINGTKHVVEVLRERNEIPEYCIIGEPSSTDKIGDIVKNGRRGSISGKLTVYGKQGHVAYPHLAENPLHKIAPALHALCSEVWDNGNEYFPPTSFQLSNMQSGTGATNVIPNIAEAWFNFRFSTEASPDSIKKRVNEILHQFDIKFDIEWTLSGLPFLTPIGKLTNAVTQAIEQTCGYKPELSTTGGTSDGRFIATLGTEVIEIGPSNKTIHQINETVKVDDIIKLTDIYTATLEHLLQE